jgi:hypothetical protein
MNRQQIEEFMGELSIGRVIRKLPSEDRKRVFQQLFETAPEFSAKQFSMFGLKGSFGLSDQHRENISIGIRKSLEKRMKAKQAKAQRHEQTGD